MLRIASGVESRPVNPVPPVVIITSIFFFFVHAFKIFIISFLNLKVSTQQDIVDEINSILPIQYVPQTKFKDLELHITKFSKNSPYIFNQAESKKTNKIIDSNKPIKIISKSSP